MLFRIAVALTALSLVHGAEKTASDVTTAKAALSQHDVGGLAGICLDNAALCQTLVMKAGTGLLDIQTAEPGTSVVSRVSEDIIPVMHFPLPPRRPQNHAQGLDRAGLIRAINARS